MRSAGVVAIAFATVLVLAPAAWSSGFHPAMASFVSKYQPDPPLDQFAAGRLGLIQPDWDTKYLHVAYRYLEGPGFDADEQKVLLSVWNEKQDLQPKPDSPSDWLAARSKIPGAPAMQVSYGYAFAPGPGYSFFRNCNDDAFRTATVTLQSMVGKFGASDPQVKEWLGAQDLVFQNCPGSKKNPHIPQPLQGGTPFEQAQRSYQIACANFYSENFDTAISLFNAIAADSPSPWRTLAPYLVARATIRKATLSGVNNDKALLAQAETQLNAIVAGSNPDDLKATAQRLLGFVECRLHPEERHAEEVRAIMRPGSERTLAQERKERDSYADDLDDWLSTFRLNDPSHSIDKWRRAGSLTWLLASLAQVPGSDPAAGALMKAAQSIEPNSPAYITAAFHIDRILIEQGKTDDARARLDAILAKPDTLPHSAFDQFSWMRLKLARNLDEYLKYAQRYPVAIVGDKIPAEFNDPYIQKLAAGPLLDVDSAEVMDRWLPLSVLKQIARRQIFPPPLRAQVALSVWTRAILIGDQQTARELTPVVSDLIPDLKPSLDAWRAARPGDEQRFEIALMMLRNPGMRPYVDPGIGRSASFGKMAFLRDNWWPSLNSVALQLKTTSGTTIPQAPFSRSPSFLSAAERESADREWTRLSAIDGPEFLCSEAIRHGNLRPSDARIPEALYRCIAAVHLGPANDRSNDLAKSAFRLLHRRYANSTWAGENSFWYRGGGSPTSLAASFERYTTFIAAIGAP